MNTNPDDYTKRLTRETIVQMVEYYYVTKSIHGTAIKFGVNRNTVRRHIENLKGVDTIPGEITITRTPYIQPSPQKKVFTPPPFVKAPEKAQPAPLITCRECHERPARIKVIDGQTIHVLCNECSEQSLYDPKYDGAREAARNDLTSPQP